MSIADVRLGQGVERTTRFAGKAMPVLMMAATAVRRETRQGNRQVTTKLIFIVGASVAAVVLMVILGKMADGKPTETKDGHQS